MKKSKKSPNSSIREPIQVYLTPGERSVLDQLAADQGLSRAEVLRRSLAAYAVDQTKGRSPVLNIIKELRSEDWPENVAEQHDTLLAQHYRAEGE